MGRCLYWHGLVRKMKIAVIFFVGIAICLALLINAGRINRYGWDLSPFPHQKTPLQLRKDRLALYSLQQDAAWQRQNGKLSAANKDYQMIISGPITLRNGNDYIIKAYVSKAHIGLRKVKEQQTAPSPQTAPSQQTVSQAGEPPTRATASAPGQTSRRGHDWGARTAARLSPEVVKARRDAEAPSEALRLHGQALYEAGDLAGAEQAYLKALDAAPTFGGYVKLSAPFIGRQLGQAYLKDGKYDKAIYWLSGARKNLTTVGGGLGLELALAYVRLGDYKNASRFYSDQSILRYLSDGEGVLPQDLPGTDSPKALEASILFARGLDAYFEARDDDALVDLQAAHALVPDNPLIAYHCARILSEKRRFAEATPLYECAVTGRGFISKEATRRLIGIRAPAGPTQPSKPLTPSKPMTQ